MEHSLIEKLQKFTKKALESQNTEDGIKYLAEAFAIFSKESLLLKESHIKLTDRLENVSQKLSSTNNELLKKIKERNTITNYLHKILQNISQGIIFIDTDGIITTFNKEAEKILEIKTSLFKHYSHIFQDNFFGFSIKKTLELELSYKQSILTKTFANQKKQLEISTSFVKEEIPFKGLIILIKDITEVKKFQMIANRNDRMKELGEMAATVAHEIKNPLGGIRGYASLLYRDLENSQHLQEMAKYIIDGTKALEKLVNNVLHFSKPISIEKMPQDICEIIKDIIKFIKVDPSFPKYVHLEYHIPKNSIICNIDKELIKSSILNLLLNAFQAIQKKGAVVISVMQFNESCIINISDTGSGIENSDLENIFTPFFTTKEKGTGLGLPEAYKIIQEHKGNIEVRSQKNFGTTFTISLSIHKEFL